MARLKCDVGRATLLSLLTLESPLYFFSFSVFLKVKWLKKRQKIHVPADPRASAFKFLKLKPELALLVPYLINGAAEPTSCCKVFFSHDNVSSDHLDGLAAVANRQHRYS